MQITEADIEGHWQRVWLRAPGFEDGTTRVHWMQVGGAYADVRIPLERPDLGTARRPADLSPADLALLAEAEGFAGRTLVAENVCTWAREINWHGETAEIDAGRLSFEADGDLIEDGVHADYAERWTRRAQEPVEAIQLSAGEITAYLVSIGERFTFGLGRADAPNSAECLADLERGIIDEEALTALFDRVHLVGRWAADGAGRAVLATNPFLEGTACIRKTAEGVLYTHLGFDGARHEIPLMRVEAPLAVA